MKSLVPWFCLVAATGSQTLWAEEGLINFRQGNYFVAGKNLMPQVGKDPVADYYMARMRLFGFGELKNDSLALRYFLQSAEKGFLPAQQLMAHYYLIKENNPEKALHWFKKAAAGGDTQAQLYSAAAHLFGYGTKKNIDVARRYFIDAARKGNALAQYELGLEFLSSRDHRNKKLGVIWLNKAAENGNLNALVKLGELYATGIGVAKDVNKAQELLQRAASQNDFNAMLALGNIAKKDNNLELAKSWYDKAAAEGNADAQFALAQLYLDEKGGLYDAKVGFMWMLRAAQNNKADAQAGLAVLYKEGKVVGADSQLAEQWQAQADATRLKEQQTPAQLLVARWLSHGKADNFAASHYNLGGIYNAWQNPMALKENNYNQYPRMDEVTRQSLYKPKFKLANPQDIAISEYFDVLAPMLSGNEANDWSFKRYPINRQIQDLKDSESLALKHPKQFRVAKGVVPYPVPNDKPTLDYIEHLTHGWEHQANYQSVLTQLYDQAILGESDAQYEIGQLYQYGIAVAKNPDQAVVYFELAASQQDVRAEYNLGILYLEGQTNPVDYQKGIDWMTDAAFKGNPYAQYALANIYEKGFNDPQGNLVVQPDHQQAMAMYYLASSNRFGEAQYRLADYLVKENNAGLSVAARKNRNQLIKRLLQGAAKQGVAEAVLPLAFYHAMDADPARQKQAFETAKREADAGNPEAALLLAILYERGISVPKNQIESRYWYQKASLNPVTAFILGTYYVEGQGFNQDMEKGRALLQQAANQGFSYANLNLAILKKQAGESFLPELDKARQQNNSLAGLLLADYFLQRADNPDNMKQARDIYQHFADKGDKDAQLKLAYLYDRGLGGEANAQLAEQLYTAAAEQGQPVAQYLLAQFYQMGRGGLKPDYDKAKQWYTAAKKSFAPAAVALGFVYDTVDDDYLNAADNYQQAANRNNIRGIFNLGLVYEYGKGQPVNYDKAEALYLRAAQKGYGPAMNQLAGIYFRGDKGKRDEQKALHWYKKAADLGDRDANYQLGLLSETGVATKLDFGDAVRFYQQSSDLGNEKAKMALARMYQYGLGVEKDIHHAGDLYKELAANNNAYAQYRLAMLYLEGALGEKMPERGRQLLKEASNNGSQQAQKVLQWLDAQQASRISFIEPLILNRAPVLAGQTADLMYLDALSEWNRGDETLSRMILNRLMSQFPHYIPAKRAYEQLNQQNQISIFG